MENAAAPKVKGELNGLCNRTACQSPNNVEFYNYSTQMYYCPKCARMINEVNRTDAMRLYNHDLCIKESERPELLNK